METETETIAERVTVLDRRLGALNDCLTKTQETKTAGTASIKAQGAQIDRLLALQVETAEEGRKRGVLYTRLVSAAVAVLTTAGAGGVYLGTRSPTPQQERERVAPIVQAVSSETDARVEKAERKIKVLGDIVLDQQVVISEGFEYIGKKLDAVSPQKAAKVAEPESLQDARIKAEKIKRGLARDQMFRETTEIGERLEGIN